MSWNWDWKTAVNRQLAIDEAMISLVELSHELEQALGEPPWSLSKVLNAAMEDDRENSTEPMLNICIDTIFSLPNTTLWPMIYIGLSHILWTKTWDLDSKLDPKVFDAFRLKIEKDDDELDLHGFKKLMEMENSSKRDVLKALCNTNRLSESSMNNILDHIEEETESSNIGVFEVGMEVQKTEQHPKFPNGPGWPPFAKEDEKAIIDRIDESDSTLFLRFENNRLWWISCDLVEPTNSSYNTDK